LDLQDFDKFWKRNGDYGVKDTELIVVSTPKNIIGEWRYIVTDQKEIIGTSLYQYGGQRTYVPSAPERATKLVKEILDVGWYPDPVFTIDIVEDNDHNYWLMEMNSFTSAGTYAAPKAPIVKRVSEIAWNQWVVTHTVK
jgi:ATP-grasp domain, R2K clade family 3